MRFDRRAGRKSIASDDLSDWERKGGPFALVLELVRRGIQVQLTVIGAAPHGMDEPGGALGRIDGGPTRERRSSRRPCSILIS